MLALVLEDATAPESLLHMARQPAKHIFELCPSLLPCSRLQIRIANTYLL
jgi:hypothetical protein